MPITHVRVAAFKATWMLHTNDANLFRSYWAVGRGTGEHTIRVIAVILLWIVLVPLESGCVTLVDGIASRGEVVAGFQQIVLNFSVVKGVVWICWNSLGNVLAKARIIHIVELLDPLRPERR